MATFWRTYYHEGKNSPAWCGWGGGMHAQPFSLYLPSCTGTVQSCGALYGMLQLRRQIHNYTPPISTLPLYVLCGISTKLLQYYMCSSVPSIFATVFLSVVDPDSDPEDLQNFGPPGSGTAHCLFYGSGSFHHPAKIARKVLISTVL